MIAKHLYQTFRLTPPLVVAAYATGNVMGAPMKIAGAVCDPGGTAFLRSLALTSKGATFDCEVHFFCAAPTATGADKAAFTLTAADMANWVGAVKMATATEGMASATGNVLVKGSIGLALTAKQVTPITGVRSQDLWAVLVARGAFTPTGVADVVVMAGIEQG